MAAVEGRESPEMYLKTVFLIREEKGYCRSIDISRRLELSKPSVSVAVGKLKREGFLTVDEDGMIALTPSGQERAQVVLEKYHFWVKHLEALGLGEEQAKAQACRFEHVTSDEIFQALLAAEERNPL